MQILAISGSLRHASINSAFCRVAVLLAPTPMHVTFYSGLGALPLFNPDLEAALPEAVKQFRAAVGAVDALLIASPEYAHGISGVMKNALDWLVSFEGMVSMPVALVNTSPRARHAAQALREVLQTMSATLIDETCMVLPLLGTCTTEEAMLCAPEVCRAVQAILHAIAVHLSVTNRSSPVSGHQVGDSIPGLGR